jgi:hypothetical protein
VFSASLGVDICSDYRVPIDVHVDFYHASSGVPKRGLKRSGEPAGEAAGAVGCLGRCEVGREA